MPVNLAGHVGHESSLPLWKTAASPRSPVDRGRRRGSARWVCRPTQERQTGGGVDKLADRSGNCPVRRLAPGPYPQPLTPSPGATSLAQAKRPIRSTEGTRPALGEFIFAQEKTVLNALCAYG